MQMDSYYYASLLQDDHPFFYGQHGAAPASPELPFDFIAASPGEPPLYEPQPPTPRASAFRGYGAGPEPMLPTGGAENVHRRVIGALGRMEEDREQRNDNEEGDEVEERRAQPGTVESSRGFRHMMRERQRREKLSQSYADLYAMVAARSKGDKNSIVQSAAMRVHELKGARAQLQRRNEDLKARILGHDARQQCVKVQFEVDEPSSAIDSIIGALRRLKSMDVRARGIKSDMSGKKLRTEMNVETTIAASDVEKAVEEALMQETERNNRMEPDSSDAPFPGTSNASSGSMGRGDPASHMQNVF